MASGRDKQYKLNPMVFTCIITAIMMADWMACDIFLPAEPEMLKYFSTSEGVLNNILFQYFVFSAISTLFGGPLSDRFGRRYMMLSGVGLFTAANLLCAAVSSIEMLILCRILSACGAGFMTSVGFAMIKDYLDREAYSKATAVLQSTILVGPIISPFIGSFMLMLGGWRFVFLALGIISLLGFIMAFRLPETLPPEKRISGGITASFKGMWSVVRDKNFTLLMFTGTAMGLPYMALNGSCAYIVITEFGCSYLQYSICYGFMAALGIIGPYIYLWLERKLSHNSIIWVCIGLFALSSLAFALFGFRGVILFNAALIPYALMEGMSRPLVQVMLLNMKENDVGSAASLNNFCILAVGAVGTVLGTLPWHSFTKGFIVVCIFSFILALILWLAATGRIINKNIK